MHESQTEWLRGMQPAGTAKAYASALKAWSAFCVENAKPRTPASPALVSSYARHMFEDGYARNTINVHLAAIASEYKFSDVPSPTRHALVAATRQVVANHTPPPKSRKPLLPDAITRVVNDANTRLAVAADTLLVRDVFMMLLMVAGFLRPAEAMALLKEHVTVEELELSDGSKVPALCVFIGRAQTDACALTWYHRWRATWAPHATHVFHDVRTGTRLSAATPLHRFRALLKEANIPDWDEYVGHSARPGGATEAARSGVVTRLIKRHGFWRSDAVYVYVHDEVELQLSVAAAALPKAPRPAAAAAPMAPAGAAATAIARVAGPAAAAAGPASVASAPRS
jgi:integrase